MARNVQIDFTDEIVKVILDDEDINLHVHKHLLRERSDLLKADVEEVTDGYLDWTRYSWLDLTSASQYLGFLYGNPMWITAPGSEIDSAWDKLDYIHSFSMKYEDFDAADACLDGMRELLEHRHSDFGCPFACVQMDLNTPCGRLVLDYMVYGSFDIRSWIDVYDSCQGEDNLEEALSKKFAEAAQRKKDEIGEPDLMERCRYHLHVEKGLPWDFAPCGLPNFLAGRSSSCTDLRWLYRTYIHQPLAAG